ncbi:MAG: hypothetical protein Q9191_004454 [Dirinaria sp. TL-2023a]
MNNCNNPPSHFFSSWCASSGDPDIHPEHTSSNPLAVQVFCNDLTAERNFTDPSPEYDYTAFCRADEICITQEDVPNPWLEGTDEADAEGNTLTDLAWCVSQQNFVHIAQNQLSRPAEKTPPPPPATAVVVAPWKPAEFNNKRRRLSVEANLLNPDGTKREVLAREIRLEAQMQGLVSGEKVWHPMAGGGADCKLCSSLQLGTVPTHAQRIVVSTVLQGSVEEAWLYLTKLVTR